MAELVAAGAPELPEGYFYRVRETSISNLRVEIRHQKGRWRSTFVEDAYVHHDPGESAEESIVGACTRVFERWQGAAAERAAYRATTKFLGDHDPRGGR
ncbi:hypothetical protein [Streptomyces sp. NTK 937]|uniref:hypothetical protein n=1 Tax=Streptomyces sp. NTK 937 TaxID=1487711 RepID=UPI0012FE8221|nr:hypothetical protein [Streptomyces sp. NTK 937]